MSEQTTRRRWFSGRSLRWRLSLLGLIFAAIFVLVAIAELYRERIVFDREMNESAQSLRVTLRTTLEVTASEMVHLSALIASEPAVRELMRNAYEALHDEGGRADGPRTAAIRDVLAERMRQRRASIWSNEFSTRQVSFHLMPGGVNFLRVVDPRRYGDAVHGFRPLVEASHEFGIPVSGFEIGRMYAGVRGVFPLRVNDFEAGEFVTVGSVEVGVSLRDLLSEAGARFRAEYALGLDRELVEAVMFPDDIRATLEWNGSCGCYVDGLGDELGARLLGTLAAPGGIPQETYQLLQVDDRWFGVTRVPLSGLGDQLGAGENASFPSSVFVFFDRTELVEGYRNDRIVLVVGLVLGYLVVLLSLWGVLRRIAATEEALAAEQRFRSALFTLSPDSVLVTDRAGAIVEVNPRFCEVTGYQPDEVIGRNARVLQSGHTPREVYEQMWETLLAGNEWRGDLQNRRKDGTLYWEAHAVVPVRDARGDISHFVSFQRDISDRHEMERALTASERLYRSIHDNVQEAIFVVQVEGDDFRFLGNNPRHQQATALGSDRIRGARLREVLPPEVADALCLKLQECLQAGQTIRYEEELDLPVGRRHWRTSLTPVQGDDGAIELIVGLAVDLTEQKLTEAELRRLATTDVLTGLASRRYFLERAENELARVRRYATPSAFMMLDIDHFKRINDTWGHATGDAVLRALANALLATVRENDIVGRLGGEEFGILLPQTELEPALALAERLRGAVSELRVEVDGEMLRFSASFGVTLIHADDDSFDMPMARADAALYAAKFAGRDRVKWRAR